MADCTFQSDYVYKANPSSNSVKTLIIVSDWRNSMKPEHNNGADRAELSILQTAADPTLNVWAIVDDPSTVWVSLGNQYHSQVLDVNLDGGGFIVLKYFCAAYSDTQKCKKTTIHYVYLSQYARVPKSAITGGADHPTGANHVIDRNFNINCAAGWAVNPEACQGYNGGFSSNSKKNIWLDVSPAIYLRAVVVIPAVRQNGADTQIWFDGTGFGTIWIYATNQVQLTNNNKYAYQFGGKTNIAAADWKVLYESERNTPMATNNVSLLLNTVIDAQKFAISGLVFLKGEGNPSLPCSDDTTCKEQSCFEFTEDLTNLQYGSHLADIAPYTWTITLPAACKTFWTFELTEYSVSGDNSAYSKLMVSVPDVTDPADHNYLKPTMTV